MSGVYPVGSGGPGVDSFATVQDAANALSARGLANYVEFPIAQSIYTGPVLVRNVANSQRYMTRFRPKAGGATIDAGGARYAFSVEGTDNVAVQGLRFTGVRDTGSACIRFVDSDWGDVLRCRITAESAAVGLLVERAQYFSLDSLRVEGNLLGSESRGLDFRDCRSPMVKNCSILGTVGTGISVTGGSDYSSMNTGIRTASEYGVRIENSPRVSITACVVIGRTDNGLHVVNSPGASFDSCLINGTHKQAAYFESCDSLRSLALMLFGTSERGTDVVRSRGCEFMRLTIQTGPVRGLVLDRSPDCLIDSLQVVNVHSDTAIGVLLDSSPNSVFRWAMLYGDYGRAFSVNRSSGSRFVHARVHGTAAEAAMTFGQSSGVKVQPCSLVCAAPASVVLGDSCNDDTLARMTILGATVDGIKAQNCRGLVVANSCVRGWTGNGLVLAGAQSPRLYYNAIVGPESAGVAGANLANVTGAEAKDNIIWNRGLDSSSCYRITGTFPFAPGASDHSDLYASVDGSVARVNETAYATLADWRAHPSTPDGHSISADPAFVTDDPYHLSSASPCRDAGIPIAAFPYDIEFDERDTLTPDIGADEFTPGAVGEAARLPQLLPALLISPNPCRGATTIRLLGSSFVAHRPSLSVYDACGRLVLSQPAVESSSVLSTSSFPCGVYMVRLGSASARFIVQR